MRYCIGTVHNGNEYINKYFHFFWMISSTFIDSQNRKMGGQTTQWEKDTKGAIRSRKWKDRQHNGQKIPKGQSEVVNGRTDNTMAKRYQRSNQKS
jgi:hypothetical protein